MHYNLIERNNLLKEYDSYKFDEKGLLVKKNGKYGIKDISSFNSIYEIPVIYDEIKNIDSFDTIIDGERCLGHSVGSVTLVRNEEKWGSYCYLLNSKNEISTSFVDTVFDDIELFYLDKENTEIYFKVYLNGKCGIYAIYSNSLITPISFDKITSCNNLGSKTWTINGMIGSSEVIYDGLNFKKVEKIDINYSEEYTKVKKLIKK